MNKFSVLFLLLVLSIQFISCDNQTVYEGKKDFKNGYWLYQEPVVFPFEIKNAEVPYDLSFFVRNSLDYPYQNLYLQYYLEDSTGNIVQEKLYNVLMFNPKTGKPVGGGIGDIFDLEKTFLTNYQFPEKGLYRIRMDQFMRHDTLRYIFSVGLKVKKSRPEDG